MLHAINSKAIKLVQKEDFRDKCNHSICASVRQMISLSTQPCAVIQMKIVVSLGSDYTSATNDEITFFLNLSIFRPKSSFARNISYFSSESPSFCFLEVNYCCSNSVILEFQVLLIVMPNVTADMRHLMKSMRSCRTSHL